MYLCLCVCVCGTTTTTTTLDTRMSSVFLDLFADPVASSARAPSPASASARARRQLFHSPVVLGFLLIFFSRFCSALAGILSAEIYDILVGNAHLSYRNVGIALLLHKAQPRLSSRLANVAVAPLLCHCLCPCNAYFRHDLTVRSVQGKSVLLPLAI